MGLGSNQGDPVELLCRGIQDLKSLFSLIRLSSLYKSTPMYDSQQPSFFNAVFWGETDKEPLEVLKLCQEVENRWGRVRDPLRPKGPRSLDVDILFYDQELLSSEWLTLPHPGISERGFVLIPLKEIAPDWIHPGLNKTPEELLRNLPNPGVYLFPDSRYDSLKK